MVFFLHTFLRNLFAYHFRSSDGRIVVVSSLDGYCSIISFESGELGKRSSVDPIEYVSSKLKEKREAKKEAKKVQIEGMKEFLSLFS